MISLTIPGDSRVWPPCYISPITKLDWFRWRHVLNTLFLLLLFVSHIIILFYYGLSPVRAVLPVVVLHCHKNGILGVVKQKQKNPATNKNIPISLNVASMKTKFVHSRNPIDITELDGFSSVKDTHPLEWVCFIVPMRRFYTPNWGKMFMLDVTFPGQWNAPLVLFN